MVQHSYKRIESLECGRTGKFICKIDRLGTIFANSRIFSSHKHAGRAIDENSPCDFCSRLFFTSPHGFSMYLRPFTFGSDIGEGKFGSIFLASSARNFDGTLPWLFQSIIGVSSINQNELAYKWKKNSCKQTQHHLFSKTDFKIQQCECRSCPVYVTQVRSITFYCFCMEWIFRGATPKNESLKPNLAKKTWLLQLYRFQRSFWCWCAVTLHENGQSLHSKLHPREATMILSHLVKTLHFLLTPFVGNTSG